MSNKKKILFDELKQIVNEDVLVGDKDIHCEKVDKDENSYLVCEMAKVADFDGYKLWIWTNDEGKIPHFHVIKGNPLAPSFDSCIKFKVSEYFPHGGRHKDKLPRNHLKDLVELLKSQDPYAIGQQTIWQALIIEWNRNDNKEQVSPFAPIPDFMHIVYPKPQRRKHTMPHTESAS